MLTTPTGKELGKPEERDGGMIDILQSLGLEMGSLAEVSEDTLEAVTKTASDVDLLLKLMTGKEKGLIVQVRLNQRLEKKCRKLKEKIEQMRKDLVYRGKLLDEHKIKYTKKL